MTHGNYSQATASEYHRIGMLFPLLRLLVYLIVNIITRRSSLLFSLWLWDVLHALRLNLPLNFSPNEILLTMPSSDLAFQDVYRNLLQESGGNDKLLLFTMGSNTREQAIILLLAILSDSMTIRRSLGSAANVISPVQMGAYRHNPFVPYTAHTELERMQGQLLTALDRWYAKFQGSVGPEIIALYHYSKLYLSCPAISVFPQLAQHQHSGFSPSQVDAPDASSEVNISDQSVSHAWSVLDIAATSPKCEETLCPAWMPIVVFHAALVVWASISYNKGCGRDKSGSKRALLAFKVELDSMPWPCCADMATFLQKLMSN